MTRFVAIYFLVSTASLGWGQGPTKVSPDSVSPQVIINVRKHPIGPDMVEVTTAEKGYPLDVLRKQCQSIAGKLHSEARGLSVFLFGYDPAIKFARATFATDGIIDRDKGEVKLNAIVQGMVEGRGSKPMRSFLVTLENEAPVDKQTLQSYSSDAVVLKANASLKPKAIEYRILVLTDDPSKIDIPDKFVTETVKQEVKQPVKKEGVNWLPIALVLVAGVAGGALVYFAVSGRPSRAKGQSVQRK